MFRQCLPSAILQEGAAVSADLDNGASNRGNCAVNKRVALAIAQELVPAWRGRAFDAIEYLPGGYTHRNYKVDIDHRAYALRLVEGDAPRAGERDYLAIAAAPDVLAYDQRRGHMVTYWIDAPLWANAPPTPAEAGRCLAQLHRQIPQGVRRYDVVAEIAALLGQAGRVDAAVLARLRRLRWLPAQLRGCHNDLNPWNVLRTKDGFRTLDWEVAGDNDPLFDLVGLGLGLEWQPDAIAECVDAYRQAGMHVRHDADRMPRTILAFRIREYAWAVAQLALGNRRPEIEEQATTMRRLIVA